MNRLKYQILCSLIMVLQSAAFAPVVIAQSSGTSWIGTWATPPVQAESGRSFSHQTLRQIVHTSVDGSGARIQISNLFGAQPLHVEDVHIAVRGIGSSIIAATDR